MPMITPGEVQQLILWLDSKLPDGVGPWDVCFSVGAVIAILAASQLLGAVMW